MSLVTLSHVSKYFGGELVLDDVSFRVERGDHAALIGTNGAGKSTILRMVAGEIEPDSGSVTRARGTRIVYLPQEPNFDASATLYATMLDVFRDIIVAQDRLRELELGMAAGHDRPELVQEYGQLQALVEHVGYDYREQIERVLAGLELGPESWQLSTDSLSGGQRTRANLARTLLQEADLLLLDEPTNHLDIQAVEWLESYLRDLRRAFVVVSHDRYLLDHITKRTIELSFHHATEYDAPYSRYVELKAERTERRREEYETQQQHIAKTEDYIRRYGAGQRAREARGREKRLDRLERIERPQDEESIHIRLDKPKRSGDIVLEARDLVAGYTNKPLVRLPQQVVVRRGERIAIMGPNGCGKTTLLRTLIGALPPLEGSTRWGANTSVGYYSQTLEGMDDRRTVLEELQRARPLGEEDGRSFLARFLFSGEDVFKTIKVLSGGERSRVALAKLILEAPNVLVLDEPTNHLDIASQDALQQVLDGFPGTLLFVSHDRYLIDNLAGQLWVVGGGRLARYEGTYSLYTEGRAARLDGPESTQHKERPHRRGTPDERLRQLGEEAETLSAQLAELGTSTSIGQLTRLMQQHADVQEMLVEAQREWLLQIREQVRTSSD